MANRIRILFVTRKYPPSTGGMENAAYELHKALSAKHDVTLVQWGGSNKLLPIVYPWLLLQALWHGLREQPDVIYLQDGIMAPLGWIVKTVLHRPTVMTIHGLEATYANPLYRVMVTPYIRRQTALVAVSNETKQKIQQGLPGAKPQVIYNGLRDAFYEPTQSPAHYAVVAAAVGMQVDELKQYKLLHTNGRLVRRKGVLWFVDTVLPRLAVEAGEPVLYLVSGQGRDREVIEAAINDRNMQDNVKLLGRVSDELLHALYNIADIFVMPNIPVANDMEGFGLVALEAASCGTTVVASKLEGIQDAIIDGKNGFLVQPGDADAYVRVVARELKGRTLKPGATRDYTLSHYSWAETARQYEALMRTLIA